MTISAATSARREPSDGVKGDVWLSPLDEARFGIRVARAAVTTLDTVRALAFCRRHDVRLIIARMTALERPALLGLQREGFVLRETLMTWQRDLRTDPRVEPDADAIIRVAGPDDADEVRRVARRAFHGYLGHYHSDPRLPEVLCDEVYGDWAWRSCQPESVDCMLVAEASGRIVGFGSVRLRTPSDGQAVLGGVDPDFRGRGVYVTLQRERVRWCRALGASRFSSTTLATNAGTQRAYVRLGLRPLHASYTFHKWFDGHVGEP